MLAQTALAAALATAAAANAPATWAHWKFVRNIDTNGRAGTVAVAIPPSIYANAQPSLADLRVVTADGALVPFTVAVPEPAPALTWTDAVLIDEGYVPGRYTQAVADVGPDRQTHESLDIATSLERFATSADVDASDDGTTWRTIRSAAPIYDYRRDGLAANTAVDFPASTARFLRIRIASAAGRFPISGVRVARLSGQTFPNTRYTVGLVIATHDAKAKTTTLRLAGLAAVPLDRLQIDSTSHRFARTVDVESNDGGDTWQNAASKQIVRNGPGRDSLSVDFDERAARAWRLVIHDGDDPPLRDVRVAAFGRPRRLEFDARAHATYRLLYDNPKSDAAHFDYADTHASPSLARAGTVALGPPAPNPDFSAQPDSRPWSERNAWVLWAALAVAVLGVGGAAIRSLPAPQPESKPPT